MSELTITVDLVTGLQTVEGLTLTQMECIINGLKMYKRYLEVKEEVRGINLSRGKNICEVTAAQLSKALNEFKNVL